MALKEIFRVTVALPEKSLKIYEAKSLMIPCVSGSMGVMANRVPFLVALEAGLVHIVDIEDKDIWFAITGGFCEMFDNKATIICSSIVLPENIDLKISNQAKELYNLLNITTSEKNKTVYAEALLRKKLTDTIIS